MLNKRVIRSEEMIIQGTCFFESDNMIDSLTKINEGIRRKMYPKFAVNTRLLRPKNKTDFHFEYSRRNIYTSLSFFRDLLLELGLMSKSRYKRKLYFRSLRNVRDDLPFNVSFYITPEIFKEKNGWLLEIQSEPAILYKIRQLNVKPLLNEFDHSSCIEENKKFIKDMMITLYADIVKEPKPIKENIDHPIIEKLNSYNFNSISKLYENSIIKIERGDIEDGLTDIRSSLEKFLEAITKRVCNSKKKKLKENLKILSEENLIEEQISRFLGRFLYEWLYKYLSDVPVHNREKINLHDARFLQEIIAVTFNFLIDKLIIYRT